MSAAGRVRIGFSHPYVATYSCSSGTISYSNGVQLARGVDVNIAPNVDNTEFYADNDLAETLAKFIDGTLTLNVDGLHPAAERLIRGLPSADADGWTPYSDTQDADDFGVGYITKYLSNGVEIYVPTLLVRVMFNELTEAAATQSESISFQTQTLTAKIKRGEDSDRTWKYLGADFATEALALAALQTKLGISS